MRRWLPCAKPSPATRRKVSASKPLVCAGAWEEPEGCPYPQRMRWGCFPKRPRRPADELAVQESWWMANDSPAWSAEEHHIVVPFEELMAWAILRSAGQPELRALHREVLLAVVEF